uniref:Proteasome endopeptidase complex n=1 Tax=Oryza nivara TaxID=4536 RepID=A0A0E0I3K6_ORYNI
MPEAEAAAVVTGGGSRAAGPADYERFITLFSPEGRLCQLDYAFNAVKLAGITSVGVRGDDSVYVLTHRKEDKLHDPTTITNLFAITDRIGLLATGMPGDGRAIAQEARNAAAEFRFKWGYKMSPCMLAQWIADRAQIRTQHAQIRPYGVVSMIFGIDEEKGTPELFTCDPAGQFFAHKAASAGPKEKEVMNFLEERMKSKPSLSSGTTKGLAKSALKHVLEGDFYAREFELMAERVRDLGKGNPETTTKASSGGRATPLAKPRPSSTTEASPVRGSYLSRRPVKRYSKKSRNQLSKLNLVLASLKYTVPSEASIAASANLKTTNGEEQ